MARLIRTASLSATLVAVLALPALAQAAPTAVNVRIEGKTSTIFEGPVTTDAKTITTAKGGTHPCGAGPTPTSALDDAARKGGFTWDGSYFDPPGDFFAERVAGESQTASEFWGVFVNGVQPMVGGCQVPLSPGDEALWTFDAFNKVGALTLTGPDAVRTGAPFVVRVVNSASKAGVAGVQVGNGVTDGNGNAVVTIADAGVFRLKAEKTAFIRSRGLTVCVDPPVAEPCSSGDKTSPAVRLDAPARASDLNRFGFVKLSWQGDDGTGSGVKRYRVEYRRADQAGSAFKPLLTDTTATARQVGGDPGTAYQFRVVAFDRAGHASAPATATTLVPLDNLSHRLKFSKRGWKLLARQGAYERSVARSSRKGASARLAFTGTRATLITRVLPFGGRVKLTVDGKSRIVKLRGKGGLRKKLVATPVLKPGRHTLRISSVGRNPIEIDAVAVAP